MVCSKNVYNLHYIDRKTTVSCGFISVCVIRCNVNDHVNGNQLLGQRKVQRT